MQAKLLFGLLIVFFIIIYFILGKKKEQDHSLQTFIQDILILADHNVDYDSRYANLSQSIDNSVENYKYVIIDGKDDLKNLSFIQQLKPKHLKLYSRCNDESNRKLYKKEKVSIYTTKNELYDILKGLYETKN